MSLLAAATFLLLVYNEEEKKDGRNRKDRWIGLFLLDAVSFFGEKCGLWRLRYQARNK